MIKKIISPLSYRFIKYYRGRYIKSTSLGLNKHIETNPEGAYDLIYQAISSDNPCMISRFGNNELDVTLNYRKGHPLCFLRNILPFWVGEETKNRMVINAGFFPNDNKEFARYADFSIAISREIDILGVMTGFELNLKEIDKAKLVKLELLEPFWSKKPWSALLKGKKVLVIHPFEESIRSQYNRRELLFENKDTLPEFASLQIIKAVQSIGGENNKFNTWFDALHYMEDQIDTCDYDIALIGCGAYGMPLAAHCKQKGKKAIHLGGVLQLLFGIRGKRWEYDGWPHKELINEYWVRPLETEKPVMAGNVEEACYW